MPFSTVTCSYCDKQTPTAQEQTLVDGVTRTITYVVDHHVRQIDVTGNERTFKCPNPGRILTVT